MSGDRSLIVFSGGEPEEWRKLTARQQQFLAAYCETASIEVACKACNMSCRTHYKWLHRSVAYADCFERCRGIVGRHLEAEAIRRAIEGDKIFKFDGKGNPLINPETGEPYYEVKRSDALLAKLLAAYMPERFGDKQTVEVKETFGAIEAEKIRRATDERLFQVLALLQGGSDGIVEEAEVEATDDAGDADADL